MKRTQKRVAHHLRPPFKPCVRISRTRLTDDLLSRRARRSIEHLPGLRWDVTPPDRSLGAWKRAVELRLAAMKSLRWSSRTLSTGLLDVTVMPSHLPPRTNTTEAGPLPSTAVVPRCQQYYEPLGLPPGTSAISSSTYKRRFVRRGPPGRASPVPYQAVAACPPPYPGDVLHPSGSRRCSLLPSP
jgi:hypothetical protein